MTAATPPAPWYTRHQLRELHNAVLHLPASGDLRGLRTDPTARQLVHQTRALRAAWAQHLGWRAQWQPDEQAHAKRLNNTLHRVRRALHEPGDPTAVLALPWRDLQLLTDAAAESRWRLQPWAI